MKRPVCPIPGRFVVAAWLLMLLAAVSCSVDFGGAIISYSSPDDRFLRSRELPQWPSWSEAIPSFSFIFTADTHITPDGTIGAADFLAATDSAAAGSDQFTVMGGDLTNSGNPVEYDTLRTLSAGAPAPVLMVPGNHDLYFAGWKYWPEAVGPTSGVVTIGGVTLLLLDSANGTLGARQRAWLETELIRAAGRPIIIATHFPLAYPPGIDPPFRFASDDEVNSLIALFARRGVRLVLNGHLHAWFETTRGEVHYLSVNGNGHPGRTRQMARVRCRGTIIEVEKVER